MFLSVMIFVYVYIILLYLNLSSAVYCSNYCINVLCTILVSHVLLCFVRLDF